MIKFFSQPWRRGMLVMAAGTLLASQGCAGSRTSLSPLGWQPRSLAVTKAAEPSSHPEEASEIFSATQVNRPVAEPQVDSAYEPAAEPTSDPSHAATVQSRADQLVRSVAFDSAVDPPASGRGAVASRSEAGVRAAPDLNPASLATHETQPVAPAETARTVGFQEAPDASLPPELVAGPPSDLPSHAGNELPEVLPRELPIDLSTALRVAAGQNPQVGFAQQRIQEAYAEQRLAKVLWVPSIRGGMNYHKHDGIIQDVAGDMITTSRSSVFAGLGSQMVGAGSPGVPGVLMNFHFRDAIFEPRITEQALGARRQASRAAVNDVLLETALAYMDLLEALQLLAVARETHVHAQQLGELTQSFADTGQGLVADADRARAELSIRQVDVRRAEERTRVASIRLGRVLSQRDTSQSLVPVEPMMVPIDLVSPSSALPELVATGLSTRPELAENRHLVEQAVQRLRRERYAPLLPSVLLGLSYGGNGGSPTSDILNFEDRMDFDAAVFWELRHLGLGERYARHGARSRVDQARWRQVMVMDQVAGEVAEAHAQVDARQAQIRLAESGISAAEDSYRRGYERIRDGQGLPIEALQAIQALDQTRQQYVRAVADYNRAQFQLQRALGWPISL